MLRFLNVSKRVTLENGEPLKILDGISFSISAGESVSVVGPSGSGKSTLLALAAGLDLPSSGTIEAAGTDLTAATDAQRAAYRARQLGIIFQAFHLFGHLSAFENVRLAGALAGDPEADQKAHACLEAVHLGHRKGHHPAQLSGGEKQRVAIARALINTPPLLLCDEPTGNLDTANAEKVFGLLMDLSKQRGCTLVLITHDDHLAQQTDRRILLSGGRLVEDQARMR
jgi:putative ABC transport system ATP-binding protein